MPRGESRSLHDKHSLRCIEIVVLHHLPDHQKARELLQRAADQVQPLMIKRGWRVPLLRESISGAWGYNYNYGATIWIRLRHSATSGITRPYRSVLRTLLHELAHIRYMDHSKAFYAVQQELSSECEELIARGITRTGEGFDVRGRHLGGLHNSHNIVVQAKALKEAKERHRIRTLMPRGGHRAAGDTSLMKVLGRGDLAASAAEQRAQDSLVRRRPPHHIHTIDLTSDDDDDEADSHCGVPSPSPSPSTETTTRQDAPANDGIVATTIEACVRGLRDIDEGQRAKTIAILHTIVSNLLTDYERCSSLRADTTAFQTHIAPHSACMAMLMCVGFEESGGVWKAAKPDPSRHQHIHRAAKLLGKLKEGEEFRGLQRFWEEYTGGVVVTSEDIQPDGHVVSQLRGDLVLCRRLLEWHKQQTSGAHRLTYPDFLPAPFAQLMVDWLNNHHSHNHHQQQQPPGQCKRVRRGSLGEFDHGRVVDAVTCTLATIVG
ncbi:unnamed protein product [Vitrella brassicaformis CCMP3155]|uniref:WLM domain-containing protein n=1 Tax=Vitrella brassicaformis (strain CCMP3155) TaxID=1169540 RepID=A0A0G4ENH6_VITBC|nr:unnamed protein product [Vitrella brassicaformis CCMP3155]|eukprot:CEL99408.1 unnamed protein product [Vitrella brassicaformis CCMP3155]